MQETTGLTVNVAEVLDDALTQLAGHMSDYTAAQILRGVGHPDIDVKIRRYELGVKNLQPGALDDELRAVLMLASATLAQARFCKHGQDWPKEVSVP